MSSLRHQSERGAATLVVVMVLFLIMAMMAAFANRNMVFEQRIASNYYRAGVALETAEAGAEWTLGMLNGLHINQACLADTAVTNSFRDRYLNISPSSREVTPAAVTPAAVNAPVVADCVRSEAQGWLCACPTAAWAAPASAPVAAANMQPSYLVRLVSPWVNRPGNVRIESTGCTSSVASNCAATATSSDMALARTMVQVDAALVSALKVPPSTPLTVKGEISLGANGVGLHNSDPLSNGLLLLTSDIDVPGLLETRLDTLPGTPAQQALIFGDGGLGAASSEAMFKMFFGMAPTRYVNQPAMRQVSCAVDCGPSLVAAYASGVRMAWINGPLNISTTTLLGTATSPMLIVASGPVRIEAALQLTGLLYAQSDVIWINTTVLPALLTGAMLVDGNLTIDGTVDIWYQTSVINELKNRMGSFVRVPGSWWN
ncbi:PilX N-terminal domain-containing pilus assembly protein [Roseateles sp.]|uniref:pilus assembly PilX family protein n=1 Tax=Roseateles sp. TaxID=1971397 RepID=UPI00286B4005|nr:PilX N-terminal domain-containing pilus assembly protein [Roseateles sp.]